jgi:hypothetical protein
MNGAVRYLAEIYDKIWFVTWEHRRKHAEFLYKNCQNVEIYVKPAIASAKQGILRMGAAYNEIVEKNNNYQFDPYNRCFYPAVEDWKKFQTKLNLPSNTIFPRVFYGMIGVPYEKRYTYQKIPRDFEAEKILFDKLKINKPYAFVVNDSRSSKFKFEIQTNLQIINPLEFNFWKNTLIYDWQLVIENAKEIHTVNTSWFHLARTLKLNIPKFYYSVRKVEMCEQNEEFVNDDFDKGWKIMNVKNSETRKQKWWLT